MSQNQPLVSVVMSVYNAEAYLAVAIDSILQQTYTNFEFIIIDDGSTDGSLTIIKGYHDPRIKLISRPNKGLALSLNEGYALAKGSYIARQDGDDISEPGRLAAQVSYLDTHPDVGLLGSNYVFIDEQSRPQEETHVLTHPDDLKVATFLTNQFGHGSVMTRRSALNQVGLVDASAKHTEDYDLFTRLSKVAALANLNDTLYLWRRNPAGISLGNADAQLAAAYALRDREFAYFLSHRHEYHLFAYHPSSFAAGRRRYHQKKSMVFRDLAYLYQRRGHWFQALGMLLWAIALAPWLAKNYKCLVTLFVPPLRSRWKYDSI